MDFSDTTQPRTAPSESGGDDPEDGRSKSQVNHRGSLDYESESAAANSENRKLLNAASSSTDWKNRCWNWCGLTSNDLKIRRRSQIICSICGLINTAVILLIFLVNLPFHFCFRVSIISSFYY
jgi:hypothetical protein